MRNRRPARFLGALALCAALAACSDDDGPRSDAARDTWASDQRASDNAPGDLKELVTLYNAGDNCTATLLVPNAGEEGHLGAARLTPKTYPFRVVRVRYRLGHGTAGQVSCNAGLAHQVELYAVSETKPPATPTVKVKLDIPAMDPTKISSEGRVVLAEVSPPLALTTGQHLYVAIRFAGTHPKVLCVAVNPEGAYEGNRNYWSNAAAPPYSWTQLDSFGLKGSIMATAMGYAGT